MQLVFIELRNLSFEAQQDGFYQGSAAARQPLVSLREVNLLQI